MAVLGHGGPNGLVYEDDFAGLLRTEDVVTLATAAAPVEG